MQIAKPVKLVIWDLDDTFWQGTLTEGEIVPIPRNVEIVRELARRGIISSICSKNDPDQAIAKLAELEIADYFVFPSISFAAKGKRISAIVENAALRAENVLFIDDNPMNLKEARFFNPDIMTGYPCDLLDGLLDHPNLAGKPDPELTRLKQYRFLQQKVEEQGVRGLSNEEFLRASNIRLAIDYDIEANFNRAVELINRSNQLNYTKFRLASGEAVAEFRESLQSFGVHAGCVRAVDNYGDYGLIGFFMLERRAGIKKLAHFVFSCRVMNMGIEQFVYEMLGRPSIQIAQPVSYCLDSFSVVDWISVQEKGAVVFPQNERSLVLVGGCDLLQLATYLTSNRVEFVNVIEKGVKVRYDDPGFLAGDRKAIRNCESIRKIPCWRYEDALRFDDSVTWADIVLLSMWPAMKGSYFRTKAGVEMHFAEDVLRNMKKQHAPWFGEDAAELTLPTAKRLARIKKSFTAVARKTGRKGRVFVLGCYTRGLDARAQRRRNVFNNFCRRYCTKRGDKFVYVDVDAVVPEKFLVDRSHFTREGYYTLARHVLDRIESASHTFAAARDAA